MALINNLKKQIDLPVWEWCRFAPASSAATTSTCTGDTGSLNALHTRFIYYNLAAAFWRYDTVTDSWQQLATSTTAAATGASMRYSGSQGYVGRVISAGANTIVTGLPFGGTARGYKIRILSGKGAGQERMITAVSLPVVADFGVATGGTNLGTQCTLTDSNKSWDVLNASNVACQNNWIGYNLRLTFGTGTFQSRKIISNTYTLLITSDTNVITSDPWSHVQWTAPVAGTQYQIESSTITVDTAWTTQPDNTSRYVIQSGGIYLLSSAAAAPFYTLQYYDVLADVWYVKPALTNMVAAAGSDFTLEMLPDEDTIWFSDQATGGSSNTLIDTGAYWTVNQWANYYVFIYSGLGMGQWSQIVSNTSNTLTLASVFSTPTNSTSYYQIMGYDFGIATASALATAWNTFTDSTKTWTTNQYANFAVRIMYGTGIGQLRAIQSNTATVLTIYGNWNIQPDTTSVYCIQGDSSIMYFMLGGYAEVFLHKAGDTDMLSHGRVLDSGIAQTLCCYLSDANHTIYEQAPITISTIARLSTLAGATAGYSHELQAGQWISIRGDTAYPQYYNGLFQVLSVTSVSQFTYTLALDPGGSAAGIGTLSVTTLFDAAKQHSQMANGSGGMVTIGVGNNPKSSILVSGYLYVTNYSSSSVSVINTATNVVSATITVGAGPTFSTVVGTYLYVPNSGSNTVSVIDTASKTVLTTVTVGNGPWSSTLVSSFLYVNNNGGNTVSVINTANNTIYTTITVGTNPNTSTLVGGYLYVNNAGSSNVSVIKIADNSVPTTLSVGSQPASSTTVGTYLYVNNSGTTSVSVINTANNTVTTTITVGNGPNSSTLVGTYLYVNNSNSNTISVINTATNTVLTTISVGSGPQFSVLVGTYLYVNASLAFTMSVIDTTTNTVVASFVPALASNPYFCTLVGTYLYINNNGTASVSVVNTALTNTITFASNTPSNLNGWWVSGGAVAYGARVLSGAGTTTLTLSDNIVGPFGLVTFNAWQPTFALAATSGGAQVVNLQLTTVTVGTGPLNSALVGKYLYVNNSGGTTVSVINTLTNTVSTTITVGSQPFFSTVVGSYLYVNNNAGTTVSVINTATNTVSASVTVGSGSFSSILVNTHLYVINNGGTTVSVIDTATNIVSDTVTVGSNPRFSTYVNTYLYVSNGGGTTVSVIDTTTNTVYATVTVGSYPFSSTLVGIYLYVSNGGGTTVSVIDTTTNTVYTTITVGSGPRFLILVGIYLYVNNFTSGTVSVIDTTTKTLYTTITVGSNPYSFTLVGTYLYVNNKGDNTVSVINTATNTVVATVSVGSNPTYSTLVGTYLYINNNLGAVSVINTATFTANTLTLSSSTPSTANGVYVSGTGIAANTYILSGAGTNTITLSNPNTAIISGNITFGNTWLGNMLYATTIVPTALTGNTTGTAMQIASNTGNSVTVVANMTIPAAGITRYVIADRDMIGATLGNGAGRPFYNSGLSTAGTTSAITDTTARWTSTNYNILSGPQYGYTLVFDNPTPAYILGWYGSNGGVQTGSRVVSGAGTNSITFSNYFTSAVAGNITFDAFYANELVNKRIKVLSNTGITIESTISAYNQGTQTMTITGTTNSSSSYAILSTGARAASTALIWAFNTTDITTRGRYLYSPRGGVVGIDRLDITTDSWTPIQYSPISEVLVSSSMYAYDGQNRLYFTVGVTQRLYYLDLKTNLVYGASMYPYTAGSAIIGNRMEIFTTVDGIKYLWLNRHSNPECFKVMLAF